MAKVTEFENILSDCLDRMITGETIESCLKSYPNFAAELEPLLKTVQETISAAAIEPSPEFRQRAANEFQAAIRNMPVKQGWTFKWQLRWVLPVAIILVLLATGSGTVVAATNALPDSPLYSIKMATESVQMAFTFSSEGKADLYSRFIDYRVEEIVQMVEKGDMDLVAAATDHMNSDIQAIAALGIQGNRAFFAADYHGLSAALGQSQNSTENNPPGNDSKSGNNPTTTIAVPSTLPTMTDTDLLIQHLLDDMDHNLQILEEQLQTAPAQFQPAIQHAIDVIQDGYWQVINSLS
jgi:hypothetical protein